MATIHIVCTRKVENNNITFGKGIFNGLTVTGEVYKASGYEVEYDDENGITQLADLSNNLRKCIATVTFRGTEETYQLIQNKVAAYFQELANENIFDIKVGLIISSTKLEIVEGTHPTLGIKTKTLLINNARLLEVEEPDVKELAQNAIAKTSKAKENAIERNAIGLTTYLSSGIKKAAATLGKSLFTDLSTDAAKQIHQETKGGKVGRPPKVAK